MKNTTKHMMKNIAITAFLLLSPMLAVADLKVFACEPEWAALAEEIGGKAVKASSATNALQDPHYIQAKAVTRVSCPAIQATL